MRQKFTNEELSKRTKKNMIGTIKTAMHQKELSQPLKLIIKDSEEIPYTIWPQKLSQLTNTKIMTLLRK